MFTKFDKALVPLIVGGLTPIITHLTGFEIGADTQTLIVSVIMSILVYQAPNKPAALAVVKAAE